MTKQKDRSHIQSRGQIDRKLSKNHGQNTQVEAQFIAQQFAGPLPHPEILGSYNQILPGLAERIVTSWEAESEHRRQIEVRETRIAEQFVKARRREVVTGQVLATVIALSGVGATVLMAINGVGVASLGSLTTLLVPIIGYIISGRRASSNDDSSQQSP